MLNTIATWFGPELWQALLVSLSACAGAAGIDAALTMGLVLLGRIDVPWTWRKAFQWLYTNVAPYALMIVLGAVLVRAEPNFTNDYFLAVAAITAWLTKDYRRKWLVLIKVKLPETLNEPKRPAA